MPRVRTRDRMKNEINAGSMADIAFLLLIFFLVTTTIAEDQGLLVKLPPWTDEAVSEPIPTRNLFSVLVNADNQLLVRKKPVDVRKLRERAVEFITNPEHRSDLPSDPGKAVISLQNDRGTNYETYLTVYNELLAAYNEVWEREALARYGKSYKRLPRALRKEVRKKYPMIISEAEPVDYKEGGKKNW